MLTITIIGALLYGWLSRMAGGGWPKLPLGLDGILYASVYGGVCLLYLYSNVSLVPWGLVLILVSFFAALLGKRMGHGRFIDLGTWPYKADREKIEYLMFPFWALEKTNAKFYDFIGLTLTGIICTIPCGLSLWFACGLPVLGGAIIIGAACKGLAYLIGYTLSEPNAKIEPTAIGEFLTGFFAGLPLMYAIGMFLL